MVDLSLSPDLPERSHAASDALGLWEPKRTLTLAAARKHTQRIEFLHRVLIGMSGALIALLVYYFATQSNTAVIEDDPDTSVRMINPRYSGRTSDNLPLLPDIAVRNAAVGKPHGSGAGQAGAGVYPRQRGAKQFRRGRWRTL